MLRPSLPLEVFPLALWERVRVREDLDSQTPSPADAAASPIGRGTEGYALKFAAQDCDPTIAIPFTSNSHSRPAPAPAVARHEFVGFSRPPGTGLVIGKVPRFAQIPNLNDWIHERPG